MLKVIFFDFGRVLMQPDDKTLYSDNDRLFNLPDGQTRNMINEFHSRGHLGEFDTIFQYWPHRTVDVGAMNIEQLGKFWEILSSFRKPNNKLIEYIKNNLVNKFRLAILSNFTRDLPEYIKLYDIEDLFEEVFTSAFLKIKKPDEKIYNYALNKMGVRPEESLLIDDKRENLDIAKHLGMHTIIFTDTTKVITKINQLINKKLPQ